jgi:hypothetical protein
LQGRNPAAVASLTLRKGRRFAGSILRALRQMAWHTTFWIFHGQEIPKTGQGKNPARSGKEASSLRPDVKAVHRGLRAGLDHGFDRIGGERYGFLGL